MLSGLFSFLMGLLPWLTGTGMVYALLYQSNRWHPGHHLIAIGLGCYVGFLLLALLMYQLQSRNLPVFSNWLIAWAIAGLLICWAIGGLSRFLSKEKRDLAPNSERTMPHGRWALWLIGIWGGWLVLQLSFIIFEGIVRPVSAWDTLAYWTRFVVGFLGWQEADPTQGNAQLGWRHPSTIHLLNIWHAYASNTGTAGLSLLTPWLAIYISIILASIGFVWLITKSLAWGLVVGILVTSSPVIGAQAVLSGYADIWLAAGLLLTVAILPLASVSGKVAFSGTWLLLATSLVFLKSAGISYSALIIMCALAAWVVSLTKVRWAFIATLSAATGLIYLMSSGFDLTVAGYPLLFDSESNQVRVGRYSGAVQFSNYDEALNNLWFALMSNSSYLLTGLLLIVSLFMVVKKPAYWRGFTPAYSLFLGIGLLLYALVAQGFSDHFLVYSSPDKDTGLTRFSQGWFLVSALTLAYIINFYSLSRHSNQDPATE